MGSAIRIRKARAADGGLIARLMNVAGEGIPAYLWSQSAEPGTDPVEYGARRAARAEGAFSYSNAHIALIDDVPAGMLLGYRLPDPYDLASIDEAPELLRPALELESLVPGSWYVNGVATVEGFLRRGVATELMHFSERLAREASAAAVSLIVDEANEPARRLYDALGFRISARRASVPFAGVLDPGKGDWLLMVRDLTH